VRQRLLVREYDRLIMLRIDALNAALDVLPEDRIRFHVCWSSWPGMHTASESTSRIPTEMGRVQVEKLPTACSSLLYDAAHEADADRREAFADLVTQFIERVPSPSGGPDGPRKLTPNVAQMLAGADALQAAPYTGVTTDGHVVPGLYPLQRTGVSTAPIAAAAAAFLAGLDAAQRARASFALEDGA
jgi:hypothetical protein